MSDKYTQQQFQEFMKKKKETKKPELDQEILDRATKIENDTYNKAKEARQKLEQGHQTQKKTTAELGAQGEKLDNVKQSARNVNANVKEGHHITGEIKEAKKMFRVPYLHKLKNLFTRDKLVKEKSVKKEDTDDMTYTKKDKEVKGEGTDAELQKMSNVLEKMRNEAKGQGREVNRQKTNIDDIAKYNQNSEYYMDKTNDKMRKL